MLPNEKSDFCSNYQGLSKTDIRILLSSDLLLKLQKRLFSAKNDHFSANDTSSLKMLGCEYANVYNQLRSEKESPYGKETEYETSN